MPAPQRRPGAGVIGQLLAEPHRFEFFQAVRLIELWLRQDGEAAGDVVDDTVCERVRFDNRLSLAFAPSQIAAVALEERAGNVAWLGDALTPQRWAHVRITPAFMGLLGGSGVLPLHYSERIAVYEQSQRDLGPRAFLDMLSHRSLAWFYQAWAKPRPECMTTQEGGDAYLQMLSALAGLRAAPGSGLERETLAFYATQFRSRAVSAHAIAGVCSEYFGVPFVVEPLIGVWTELPPPHQAQLGVAHVGLDAGVLLGARIFECDSRVRVRIGPLGRDDFEDFLPGRAGAASLAALLSQYCGAGITYEIRPTLRAADVCGCHLGAGEAALGVDAYLLAGPSARDRDDTFYLLHP